MFSNLYMLGVCVLQSVLLALGQYLKKLIKGFIETSACRRDTSKDLLLEIVNKTANKDWETSQPQCEGSIDLFHYNPPHFTLFKYLSSRDIEPKRAQNNPTNPTYA